METWKCTVCRWEKVLSEPPERCPVCGSSVSDEQYHDSYPEDQEFTEFAIMDYILMDLLG